MQGIVTGASRGLGLALTRALVERGWRLVVDARDGDALEHAVGELDGVIAIAGDVADPDHRRRLVEADAKLKSGKKSGKNRAVAGGPEPVDLED